MIPTPTEKPFPMHGSLKESGHDRTRAQGRLPLDGGLASSTCATTRPRRLAQRSPLLMAASLRSTCMSYGGICS